MELNTLTRYESIAYGLNRIRSLPALSPAERDHELRLAHYVIKAGAKGALAGYCGKLAFALLPVLLRRPKLRTLLRLVLSKAIGREPIAFGLFLGFLAGTYTGVLAAGRYRWGARPPRRLPLLAGGAAGLAIFFLPRPARLPLALFMCVRALEVLGRVAERRGLVPNVPHVDAALMSVASAQVLWTWLFNREALTPSYRRFLDVQGGKPREALQGLQDLFTRGAVDAVSVNAMRARLGAKPLPAAALRSSCQVLHPLDASCSASFAQFWIRAFVRALRVYLPVYVVPALLFGFKRCLHAPLPTVRHVAVGVARSAAFLASYCSMGYGGVCLQENVVQARHHLVGAFAGALCGVTVMLEKKARRIELALYVLSHALESFYRTWWRKLGLRPVPHFESLLFCASVATILHTLEVRPELVRPSYRSLLRKLVGRVPPPPEDAEVPVARA